VFSAQSGIPETRPRSPFLPGDGPHASCVVARGWGHAWDWECREDRASYCSAVLLYRAPPASLGGRRVHRRGSDVSGLCQMIWEVLESALPEPVSLCFPAPFFWCGIPGRNSIGHCHLLNASFIDRLELRPFGVGGVHTSPVEWRMRSFGDGLQADVLECTSRRVSFA
jgi:hypothetical protein